MVSGAEPADTTSPPSSTMTALMLCEPTSTPRTRDTTSPHIGVEARSVGRTALKVTVCGEDWAVILPAGHIYGDRVGESSPGVLDAKSFPAISATETVP